MNVKVAIMAEEEWQKTFLLSFPFMDEIVPLFARRVVIQFSECVEKVFFDHNTAIVYLILFAKNNTVTSSKNQALKNMRSSENYISSLNENQIKFMT